MSSTLQNHMLSYNDDMSRFEGITDPQEYQRELHRSIREHLQSGGYVPPTEGITVAPDPSEGTDGFFEGLTNKIFNFVGAKGTDSTFSRYTERRFDFIANEEGYREAVYNDSLGRRTVGYGFNLDEETNRSLAMQVLNITDSEFEDIRNGDRGISSREARTLFEASVGQAERLVEDRFGEMGLRANQRLALVSLAYNHPNLIGPNLTRQVQSGDWASATREIRERSNRYKIKGIAARRNREADLFASYQPEDQLNNNHLTAGQQIAEAAPQPPREFTQDDRYQAVADVVNSMTDASRETGVSNPLGWLIGSAQASEMGDIRVDLDLNEVAPRLKEAFDNRNGDYGMAGNLFASVFRNLARTVGSTSWTTLGMEKFVRPVAETFGIDIGNTAPITEDFFSLEDKVAMVALADRSAQRGASAVEYQDYGRNRRGVYVGHIVGDNNIGTPEDRERASATYGSDVRGIANLAMDTWADPLTNVGLTLGGFRYYYTENGDLVIPGDDYDAEKFKNGSGSVAGAYQQARNDFQNYGALEGSNENGTAQRFTIVIPSSDVERYRRMSQVASFLNYEDQ